MEGKYTKSEDIARIEFIDELPKAVQEKKQREEGVKEENFIDLFWWQIGVSKRSKLCIGISAFLILAIISSLTCYFVLTWQGWGEDGVPILIQLYKPSSSELSIYDKAAVSTDAAPCAVIGKDILKKNGSAVDSAIATLLCMGVVNAHSMGLGGGFLMTIYDRKEQSAIVLDARETAPKNANADMYKGNPKAAQIGGLAVAVPGELSGYDVAHTRYGKLPWKDLFTPTIELCKNGIPVGAHLASAMEDNRDIILNEPSLREIFFNNETKDLYKDGEIMKRPILAETLEKISNGNARSLYGPGEMRRKLVDDIKNFDGIITENDLNTYSPKWRRATKITLNNNFTVYSVPPPGSGALLSFMLNILDGYNLTSCSNWKTLNQISTSFHRIIEAFKFAYAYRMQLEDSDNHSVLETVKNLLDHQFADETRKKIYDTKTVHDPEYYGFKGFGGQDHGTAHVSIVAPNGDAVSVTSTINLYFGAKRRSRSTGIILNNEMDDFSSRNITNYFGVPPSQFNHIYPNRRPMSSMSPTIIVDLNRDPWLVIGGNGGTQITTGVALVASQMLWLNKNIKEAIDMPRIHHQLFPDYIAYENNFPKELLTKLKHMGHNIEVIKGRSSIILAVNRDKQGKLAANSDYRKGGKTDGF